MWFPRPDEAILVPTEEGRMRAINETVIDWSRWGTGDPAGSELWLTALVSPEHLKEDMVVLDYGCGGGRLCNYLSKRLQNFTYFGLEPPYGDGPDAIRFAREHFADPRVVFDFIGSYSELEAIKKADCVVMGSVLTHLTFEDGMITLDKFRTVADRSGKIFASVFLGQEYELRPPMNYCGCPNCYAAVILTHSQLNKLQYEITGTFLAQGIHLHHILKIVGFRQFNP